MKRWLALLALPWLLQAGDARTSPLSGGETREWSLAVAGGTRWTTVVLPSGYRPGAPVLLLLHSDGQGMRRIFSARGGGMRQRLTIADRDASVDAGVTLAWRLGDLVIGASWQADSLGRSDGQGASLRLSVPIRLGERWTTTPGVSAEWLDRNMVDYYYGVTPAETGGGAPPYTGTATTHLRAGWSLGYRIDRQWRLLGGLSWTRLGAGVADSPLVARGENLLAWAGFTWSFGHVH